MNNTNNISLYYNNLIDKTKLPENCVIFYCNRYNIDKLPILNDYLEILDCSNNILQYLPVNLPYFLTELICSYNKIIELPELPYLIRKLWCNNNLLSYLPFLHNGMKYLYCNNNKITELPELPKLKSLWCQNNNIKFISSYNYEIIKNIEYPLLHGNPVYSTYINCNI